jgi:hypothetical protein
MAAVVCEFGKPLAIESSVPGGRDGSSRSQLPAFVTLIFRRGRHWPVKPKPPIRATRAWKRRCRRHGRASCKGDRSAFPGSIQPVVIASIVSAAGRHCEQQQIPGTP